MLFGEVHYDGLHVAQNNDSFIIEGDHIYVHHYEKNKLFESFIRCLKPKESIFLKDLNNQFESIYNIFANSESSLYQNQIKKYLSGDPNYGRKKECKSKHLLNLYCFNFSNPQAIAKDDIKYLEKNYNLRMTEKKQIMYASKFNINCLLVNQIPQIQVTQQVKKDPNITEDELLSEIKDWSKNDCQEHQAQFKIPQLIIIIEQLYRVVDYSDALLSNFKCLQSLTLTINFDSSKLFLKQEQRVQQKLSSHQFRGMKCLKLCFNFRHSDRILQRAIEYGCDLVKQCINLRSLAISRDFRSTSSDHQGYKDIWPQFYEALKDRPRPMLNSISVCLPLHEPSINYTKTIFDEELRLERLEFILSEQNIIEIPKIIEKMEPKGLIPRSLKCIQIRVYDTRQNNHMLAFAQALHSRLDTSHQPLTLRLHRILDKELYLQLFELEPRLRVECEIKFSGQQGITEQSVELIKMIRDKRNE
ncbi:hypothetical protein FGO68_gene13728 [Halteria grandinella]|uniref:Uncharacterized protein n=1 Tax=Halteria grandinella TaxID=5974 RepID=A0A8J8NUD2_HALGN|nr:hypothetical protein FGO68_gene13728 [Halteria grandinella]